MPDTSTIGVIGCGNIGSRHLQGLARMTAAAAVHVCDPNAASRALAEARIAEMQPGPHLSFTFHDALASMPNHIGLAIVATGAQPRRAVIETLLASKNVGALLLEKFLFQSLDDHAAVESLLAQRGVPAWVNTPRRAWPSYQSLKRDIAAGGPLTICVEFGRAHGLATNAIHFIDLAAFVTEETGGFELDGRLLRPIAEASRHVGALEFSGVMTGASARGDVLTLRGRPDSAGPHTITLVSEAGRFLIFETQQKMLVSRAAAPLEIETLAFPILLQSALTGAVAEDIVAGRQPDLPLFAESSRLHRQCLSAFLEALGEPRGAPGRLVPVT
jgi:predicted dehydrogenase